MNAASGSFSVANSSRFSCSAQSFKYCFCTGRHVLAGLVNKAIEENASKAQDQAEYEKNFNSLIDRYEAQKKKCDEIAVKLARTKATRRHMENFIETVGKMNGCISEFDERLWGSLVDHLTVYDRKRIVFTFKGGQETTVSMD